MQTEAQRARHTYICGVTGSGKSTEAKHQALSDIEAGRGLAYVDPHGQDVLELLDAIPKRRINDVLYFNVLDREHPITFNPVTHRDLPNLEAEKLTSIFKDKWIDSGWSERMSRYTAKTLALLMHLQGSDLTMVQDILTNKPFRDGKLKKVTDEALLQFWTEEYPTKSAREKEEAPSAIINRIGQLTDNEYLRPILQCEQPSLNPADCIKRNRIVLVNLAKMTIGENAADAFGALLIGSFFHAAMSRPAHEIAPFPMYIDEAQTFITHAFIPVLSEARKFALWLTLLNQYTAQLPESVQDAIFGNVGTLISFQVGADDAPKIARQLDLEPDELSHGTGSRFIAPEQRLRRLKPFQGFYHYQGETTDHSVEPFTAARGTASRVIAQSRRQFGRTGKRSARLSPSTR
ncbi:MAG: ATP-binding protein [Alphaproteobacteria bacterium]|nr:MAG: ATP-binding protein [Alphaproteobacteria bacterium]